MIGIDTNVLLRLLVHDHDAQAHAAQRFISTHCSQESPGFVSCIVIAEIAWSLKRLYGYDRSQIVAAIRAILNVSELAIESAEEVHRAVTEFEQTGGGFVDCLLSHTNAAIGCDYTVTFDRKAAKLAGFKLLPGA